MIKLAIYYNQVMLEFFVHLKKLPLTITFFSTIGLKPVIMGKRKNLLVTKLLSLSRCVVKLLM